jgi:hypothetical protein
MLGKAGPTKVTWTKPVLFSDRLQAFAPVLTELDSDKPRLAIAFRDQNQGGTGMLLSVEVGENETVLVGQPKPFAQHQAQRMALVALPNSSVAVLFSEHVLSGPAAKLAGGAMYGSAILAHFPSSSSSADILGKRRFAAGAVARLEATKLSSGSFAIAFRHGVDTQREEHAEASCVFAQFRDGELIFGRNPVLLEPKHSQIWSRSVALVQENVIQYVYHSGTERQTKEAILRMDPTTNSVSVVQGPTVIAQGFTPAIGALSTALLSGEDAKPSFLQESGPRLFTFYNKGSSADVQGRICKVAGSGIPAACKEFDWINHEVLSMAGAPVGDGRLLFTYTDASGTPFYQLVGLLESEY